MSISLLGPLSIHTDVFGKPAWILKYYNIDDNDAYCYWIT